MRPIKLADPCFDEAELSAVRSVLESGQLVQSQQVKLFEDEFAERVGARYCVMVSSGTAALHLSVVASGIGHGDAVAVPDYTFVATANAVSLAGAVPVLVDVDPVTYNIDPDRLRDCVIRWRARTGNPQLRAIMPVHQFGLPAHVAAIREIAAEHDLLLLEDAACAIGSEVDGRPVGMDGAAACFSFHPRKVLTTGEGGAVVTDDGALADRLRALRAHGFAGVPGNSDLLTFGFNYRMTEMQAAIGRAQLRKLDGMLQRRRQLAVELDELLSDLTWFRRPTAPEGTSPNWQSYVGVLAEDVDRSVLMASLLEYGIEARSPAGAVHFAKAYREMAARQQTDCPVAEHLDAHAMAIPLHSYMTSEDVVRVVEALRKARASQ